MKMHNSRLFRFVIALLGFVTVVMVPWGQGQGVPHNRIPLAEDWSHRHLIFSSPTTIQQTYRLQQDYRYWNQWFRRNAHVQAPAVDKASFQFAQPQRQENGIAFSGVPNRNDEGSGGQGGAAGSSTVMTIATTARSAVPAAPSRQPRPWTIYGMWLLLAVLFLFLLSVALGMKATRRRRLAFGLALGLVAAFLALQIGCAMVGGGSTPVTPQSQSLQRDWATSLTANATVGEGMYPAKFTFDITAAPSCTNDFVVFTTGLSAGATTVDIIAYNQLYSGAGGICSGGPSVLWAYQTTSSGGRTATSSVLSLDGTQVVYMEGTGGTGVLHILRPGTGANAGTLSAPVTPAVSVSAAAYNTCKATPSNVCLFNISFGNAADDSSSAPFYDYGSDMLYAGDNGGNLHRFTGVFNGSPAETTTAPWPVAVHSAHRLLGPVKDDTSGNIFVTDVDGTLSYVRETGSTVGACAGAGSPPCLGSTTVTVSGNNGSIVDPPIVDSTQGRVFAFTGNNTSATFGGANVVQADTALSASVVRLDVGIGSDSNLHISAFDNTYFASIGTGHLYVCANSGANSGSASGVATDNQPTLKRISFNSNGTMNSVDAGMLVLTAAPATCSPVTEILNGGTDRIFMSVQANGPGGCGGNGCVMSVKVPTASPFTFPAAVSALLPEPGGTSGIVIDNVSSSGQASSIYFTILANSTGGLTCNGIGGVGCAVKATQSGLN